MPRPVGHELPMELGRAMTVAGVNLMNDDEARSSTALTRGDGEVHVPSRQVAKLVVDVLAGAGVHGSEVEIVEGGYFVGGAR